MELSSLLALPDGLEVAGIAATDKLLTVRLASRASSSICPLCAHAATHVRSYYSRLVGQLAINLQKEGGSERLRRNSERGELRRWEGE